MRRTFWALVLIALFAGRLTAKIPAEDGVRGRIALNMEVRALLQAENFRELDRRASAYAKNKETLTDGWWKLTQFFAGLGDPDDKKNEAQWREHLERIARWVAASPANETALTAQGVAYTRYAWAARGGGYADKVSQDGWKLFAERLVRARAILDSVRSRGAAGRKPSAGWYSAMLTIAMGQSWERPEYDAFFQEAVDAHPDYYEFYIKKGTFLLPRWYGAEGEWQQFAREAGKRVGPDVFARICWANASLVGYNNLFTECGFGWDELAVGFSELHRKYPKSAWTLNAYCRVACGARQRKAAAELFTELGDDYYSEAWPSKATFVQSRAWALRPR